MVAIKQCIRPITTASCGDTCDWKCRCPGMKMNVGNHPVSGMTGEAGHQLARSV